MTATSEQTLDEIIHGIFLFAITAASIFVKNPASQQHAASIINATSPLLAIADGMLNPTVAP